MKTVIHILRWMIPALLAVVVLQGCGKSRVDAATEEYQKHVAQCRDELAKSPLIPIIGGGYLDTRRFAFNVPSVRYEDGQCGTNMFVTDFYWTGEKIVPAHEKFTGIPQAQTPKNWLRFQVGARLGNQRWARECKAHPDPDRCPKSKPVGYPPIWPQDLVVKPKHYPGLEIWLPLKPSARHLQGINFVLSDWRRDDGRPRGLYCDTLGHDFLSLSKEALEDIDVGTHMFPCQVEYWDFTFKGGAARVHTGTEALHDITPALKALHQYISNSIIQEK